MSEWKEYKLEDLGFLQRGRSRHRPRYAFHLYGGKYPFVQTGEIREAKKYVTKFEKTYSEEGLKQSKLWPKGTLCITIAANIAELAILSFDACFPDSVLGFIPDQDKVDLDFVYYTLVHFQKELKHIGEGSVQDNINLGTFQDVLFPIPPLEEQHSIASVLSSLDDKIDLLHRQNQTLEQMAETLFRQWFVEEADEDWEEKPLSDYFQLLGGFAFKSKDYLDVGKYKVVTIKGVQDGYLDSRSAARLDFLPEKIKPYQILNTGDILMSLTGNVGRVCLVDDENCLLNQRVAKIEPINRKWKAFAYFYFRQNEMIERLTYLSKGSAQLNLSPVETLAQTEHFPDDSLIDSYCEVVIPFLSKIMTNKTQIRTLTALRDTLLPKLMSGEVRVEI